MRKFLAAEEEKRENFQQLSESQFSRGPINSRALFSGVLIERSFSRAKYRESLISRVSRLTFLHLVDRPAILTIQNRVSFAKLLYWSIVDKTLNMRHTNTTMNLKRKRILQYTCVNNLSELGSVLKYPARREFYSKNCCTVTGK